MECMLSTGPNPFNFFFLIARGYKLVKPVGGGSVINGAPSGPRLVLGYCWDTLGYLWNSFLDTFEVLLGYF